MGHYGIKFCYGQNYVQLNHMTLPSLLSLDETKRRLADWLYGHCSVAIYRYGGFTYKEIFRREGVKTIWAHGQNENKNHTATGIVVFFVKK